MKSVDNFDFEGFKEKQKNLPKKQSQRNSVIRASNMTFSNLDAENKEYKNYEAEIE